MVDNSENNKTLTWRGYLKYGGTIAGSEPLAGRSGTSEPSSSLPKSRMLPTQTAISETASGTDTATGSDEPYTVTIEPMGEVAFDGPPERWTALLPTFADMALALGGRQTLGIQSHDRLASGAFEEPPGIDFDTDDAVELVADSVSKELFYEMDVDAHSMDLHTLWPWHSWNQSDVDEIANNVGPFFGNSIHRHSDDWHGYRYYTLYEVFGLMAEVFQTQDRYQISVELHEEMLTLVDEHLPSADQHPTALLVYPADGTGFQFYPFRFDNGGVSTRQWCDLGLTDALAATDAGHYSFSDREMLDIKTLMEIDPEVLLVRNYGEASESAFQKEVAESLQDQAGSHSLQAVEDGAVYSVDYLDQGPIVNFYHTDRAAKDIYTDSFENVTLFDRERVVEIVHRNI